MSITWDLQTVVCVLLFVLMLQCGKCIWQDGMRWRLFYDTQRLTASASFFLWLRNGGDQWVWGISHQATLGLGHPATVQCSLRVLPSQTVCPRGLTMNSGRCVRLSGFIFLRNSTQVSSYRKRVNQDCQINVSTLYASCERLDYLKLDPWRNEMDLPSCSLPFVRQIPWHVLIWFSSPP